MRRSFGGRTLAALAPPLRDYSLNVLVELTTPLLAPGSSDVVVGYYQRLGVRCAPERLQPLLEQAVTDGTVRWDESECEETRPEAWPRDLWKHFLPIEGEGVWYRSGRAFFAREESETH